MFEFSAETCVYALQLLQLIQYTIIIIIIILIKEKINKIKQVSIVGRKKGRKQRDVLPSSPRSVTNPLIPIHRTSEDLACVTSDPCDLHRTTNGSACKPQAASRGERKREAAGSGSASQTYERNLRQEQAL